MDSDDEDDSEEDDDECVLFFLIYIYEFTTLILHESFSFLSL